MESVMLTPVSLLFLSLAIKGYKAPLETKDLWSLNKQDSSDTVVPKLLKEWEVEKSEAQRYGTTRLRAVFYKDHFSSCL